jgi:cupin 2 domain-containing protein
MAVSGGNLFADLPSKLTEEQFIELLAAPNVRIERIVSTGHSSPPDHFYDQDQAEWVLVVQGSATVLFEGEAEPRLLGPGDYLQHSPAYASPCRVDRSRAAHGVARDPLSVTLSSNRLIEGDCRIGNGIVLWVYTPRFNRYKNPSWAPGFS